MGFIGEVLSDAVRALVGLDRELIQVVGLTLVVSGLATVIGVVLGVPLGGAVALGRFPGRRFVRLAVNLGMGIPPVLAGLVLLLVLWSEGPLGRLEIVFTPTAMVIAQTLLALPIAAGVTIGALEGMPAAAREQLAVLPLGRWMRFRVAVGEAVPGVMAAVVAAFGRVIAEVGAVLVVGGNIFGETRVLTTLIVQETRQARFGPALAAGILLLALSLLVNLAFERLRSA